MKIIGKVIDYFAILLLGIVLYEFWKEDIFLASILTAILIVDRIKAIIEEKNDTMKITKTLIMSGDILFLRSCVFGQTENINQATSKKLFRLD